MREHRTRPRAAKRFRRRAAAVAALVALPAIAAALYLTLGSPELPGQPLAARATTPLQDRSLDTLVAQVEAHLEKNPEDGRGWEVIAPVYMRLGRLDDAVKARRNALRINGATTPSDLEADLGETLIAAANGVVTAGGEGRVRARGWRTTRGTPRRASSSASRRIRTGGRQGPGDLARHAARRRTGFAMGGMVRQAVASARRRGARAGPSAEMSRRRSRWTRRTAPRWSAAWSSGSPSA